MGMFQLLRLIKEVKAYGHQEYWPQLDQRVLHAIVNR